MTDVIDEAGYSPATQTATPRCPPHQVEDWQSGSGIGRCVRCGVKVIDGGALWLLFTIMAGKR